MQGVPHPPSAAESIDEPKTPRNHFGLQGLLGVIRMTDANRNALALGMDLTTLGLNLNSNEVRLFVFSEFSCFINTPRLILKTCFL